MNAEYLPEMFKGMIVIDTDVAHCVDTAFRLAQYVNKHNPDLIIEFLKLQWRDMVAAKSSFDEIFEAKDCFDSALADLAWKPRR